MLESTLTVRTQRLFANGRSAREEQPRHARAITLVQQRPASADPDRDAAPSPIGHLHGRPTLYLPEGSVVETRASHEMIARRDRHPPLLSGPLNSLGTCRRNEFSLRSNRPQPTDLNSTPSCSFCAHSAMSMTG